MCWFALVMIASAAAICLPASESESPKQFVLTLDHSNFSDVVSKHDFIVVDFYASWCPNSKQLEPEYEKAASKLSSHEPKVVLAKVNVDEVEDWNFMRGYEIEIIGFPTIKIIRNGGRSVQGYFGPREADGIVEYMKKLSGPASTEIKSPEDASNLIANFIAVVGVFPELSGEEYENFNALAEKLRSRYDFGHTTNAKILPRGESSVTGPLVRLFKPFDESFVDFKDFNIDALDEFVEKYTRPAVFGFNTDLRSLGPSFNSQKAKAILLIDFKTDHYESFKNKYIEVAREHIDGIWFLIADLEDSQGAFQSFEVKEEQVPLIIMQTYNGHEYFRPNVELDQIAAWVKEVKDRKVAPFRKFEPVPGANDVYSI
ncbi:unnamed protein product [Rhodiola kirilowii]